jgi:hypothetical protein
MEKHIYNLGFTLLCNTSDNLLDLNKGCMQCIIGMVGVWKMEIFYFLCCCGNAITFVTNYKQVVQGWVQMLYQPHTLLWKLHTMNCVFAAWICIFIQ